MTAATYDVILANGQLLLSVPTTYLAQLTVVKKRKLRWFDRLPWLGLVWRYMWAKKHAAMLDQPRVFDPASDL